MRRIITFALAVVAVLVVGTEIPAAEPALHEVNAYRARRGLPPFREDPALTAAACRAADIRAAHRIAGHIGNGAGDFACLAPGVQCDATGCAAWPPHLGWGSCCMDDLYAYGGAAFTVGADGLRYMHLFVRNGPPAGVPVAAAVPCPCKCPCAAGKPCDCGPACLCESCQGKGIDYAAGYARVLKGESLTLAVGQKAGPGQVQGPAMPGVKPGVYRWYVKDGKPTIDAVSDKPAPAVRPVPVTGGFNPFAVPGACRT